MRSVVYGGLTHLGNFAISALRKADPEGKLIVVEPTIERAEVARKQFPGAEVIKKGIDEFVEYLKENSKFIDVFISCSDSDAMNYKFCRAAVEAGIPIVIPILNNPLNKELFRRTGVKIVIDPFTSIEPKLLEALKPGGTVMLYESFDEKAALALHRVKEDTIKIRLPPGNEAIVMLFKADGTVTSKPEEASKGDSLYVFGKKDAVKKYLESVKS